MDAFLKTNRRRNLIDDCLKMHGCIVLRFLRKAGLTIQIDILICEREYIAQSESSG